MTRRIVFILLILTISLLTGCGNEKDTYQKEFTFLEKSTKYSFGYGLILESEKDKKYYVVTVDNYTYDNIDFKKGDKLEFDAKKGDSLYGMLFHLDVGEKIFIFDEWKPLYSLDNYTKTKD